MNHKYLLNDKKNPINNQSKKEKFEFQKSNFEEPSNSNS